MRILVPLTILLLGAETGAKPQAFYSRSAGGVVATYLPDTETIHIAKRAPVKLRLCIGTVCKPVADWK